MRNVLAAAVYREVDGWVGERRPVELHSLQIVKELSRLQRSTVYFTSSHQAATAYICTILPDSGVNYNIHLLM